VDNTATPSLGKDYRQRLTLLKFRTPRPRPTLISRQLSLGREKAMIFTFDIFEAIKGRLSIFLSDCKEKLEKKYTEETL
jgi:hypothetical protein